MLLAKHHSRRRGLLHRSAAGALLASLVSAKKMCEVISSSNFIGTEWNDSNQYLVKLPGQQMRCSLRSSRPKHFQSRVSFEISTDSSP